jgi:ribosome assembly protein 1
VSKIVNALNIKVSPRDLKSKDTRNLLTVIMQQWLPLSTATFQAVVDVIPPPFVAQRYRLPYMLHPEQAAASTTPLEPVTKLEEGLYACDQSAEKEVVGYVSKMFAVLRSDLPEFKPKEITAEEMRQRGREERERRAALAASAETEAGASSNGIPIDGIEGLKTGMENVTLDTGTADASEPTIPKAEDNAPILPVDESSEVLLGFSRVFSGVLRRNTRLLATLPKYDSTLPPTHLRNIRHVIRVTVGDLYVMMGRELVAVEEVPAGHVCAIGGLEGAVPRNATIWAPNALGVEESTEVHEGLINLAGVSMQVSIDSCAIDDL